MQTHRTDGDRSDGAATNSDPTDVGADPVVASPASRPDVVRVGSAAAFLAVLPHLLGFVPATSLVVVGVTPHDGRVGLTLRYELPDPPADDMAARIGAHATAVLAGHRQRSVLLVGYGPARLAAPVLAVVHAAACRADLDVLDVLRVQNGRYWPHPRPSSAVPPADLTRSDRGTPVDPNHPAAGALAAAGGPVLPDRSALAASVHGAAAASMRAATRRAENHTADLAGATGRAAVAAAIAAYRRGVGVLDDDEVARLSVALRSLPVRDDAWARMDPTHRAAHRRLWADVLRRACRRHLAAPACLLAVVAWQGGDGALANVALDRALAADPHHSLALLLRDAIHAGAPPSYAAPPMTPDEVAAHYGGDGSTRSRR